MSTISDTFKSVIVPINKEGYNIIIITAVIVILLAIVSKTLGTIGFVVLCFTIYFFRSPSRVLPDSKTAIIAPADGLVDAIVEATPPEELELDANKKWTRVSIFLNVFNVHVQRVPFDGKVIKTNYRPGKFLNVAVDKYSKDNERQSCVIKTKTGEEIVFVQIAGLIARRIVCDLNIGDEVKKGDIYGIIKFGSRVDIYLPEGVEPIVKKGQTMLGGETVIAHLEK